MSVYFQLLVGVISIVVSDITWIFVSLSVATGACSERLKFTESNESNEVRKKAREAREKYKS